MNDEVYREQAERVIDLIETVPGLTHKKIANAALGGRTGLLKNLIDHEYLKVEALRRGKAIVWVPSRTIDGHKSPFSGWMVTNKFLFIELNKLWLLEHIGTRIVTGANSSAVQLTPDSELSRCFLDYVELEEKVRDVQRRVETEMCLELERLIQEAGL